MVVMITMIIFLMIVIRIMRTKHAIHTRSLMLASAPLLRRMSTTAQHSRSTAMINAVNPHWHANTNSEDALERGSMEGVLAVCEGYRPMK
jgi:hypothetical protein